MICGRCMRCGVGEVYEIWGTFWLAVKTEFCVGKHFHFSLSKCT